MTIVGSHNFHTAATASGTGEVWTQGFLLTKAICIETSAFTGTVRLQGSFDNSNWTNLAYELLGQDGAQTPTNADISFVVHTGFAYLVTKELWPFVRVNITERTAGSVTAKGFGQEN